VAASWNFATVWDTIAGVVPDRPAQVHGERRVSWRAFEARADALVRRFAVAGLAHQDKVALYLHNGPEYMQAAFACMKTALVPVNTNYRYRGDELHYLWDNADAVAVVFHGAFTPLVESVRARCHKVRLWLHVADGTHACPAWAEPLPDAPATDGPAPAARSGDDLILIYTGGTTGRPRGVMWQQHDLYVASNTARDPADLDLDFVRRRVRAQDPPPPVGLAAAPLMHGTAFVFASSILNRAGTLVTLTATAFDVAELLDTIGRERVTDLCIVGDAFCRPMVDALDAEPGRWDVHSLRAVSSSGMMWSSACKERLLAHAPEAMLIDFLNSSEASGMGRAVSTRQRPAGGARFKLGENAFVIDADGRRIGPGSGEVGRIAVAGGVPLGYYGDPEKTAATFPLIDGVRCAVPGDFARVEADGTVTLLGRGSVSINTGGEKVFPEEVEECLKLAPDVLDAVVVGVADARFGETVAAAVQPAAGRTVDAAALIAHVQDRLARYKAPRHIMVVDSIGRGPNGKADYPAVRARVAAWLAQSQGEVH